LKYLTEPKGSWAAKEEAVRRIAEDKLTNRHPNLRIGVVMQ
jgi:hypothetical protein